MTKYKQITVNLNYLHHSRLNDCKFEINVLTFAHPKLSNYIYNSINNIAK